MQYQWGHKRLRLCNCEYGAMNGQPIKNALVAFILTTLATMLSAHAGTCRIYSEGTDTVEACDDGSFSVTDR
jgi:hypothetical protein